MLLLLGNLSFEIRFCLQKYFKNYIPSCLLNVVYQSKSGISNLFNFKDVVIPDQARILFTNLCADTAMQLMVKIKCIFFCESF